MFSNSITWHSRKGIAAGCVAGSLVGLAITDQVAKEKAEFASEEEYLNTMIARFEKVAKETYVLNQQLGTEIKIPEKRYKGAENHYTNAQQQKLAMQALRDDTKKSMLKALIEKCFKV